MQEIEPGDFVIRDSARGLRKGDRRPVSLPPPPMRRRLFPLGTRRQVFVNPEELPSRRPDRTGCKAMQICSVRQTFAESSKPGITLDMTGQYSRR